MLLGTGTVPKNDIGARYEVHVLGSFCLLRLRYLFMQVQQKQQASARTLRRLALHFPQNAFLPLCRIVRPFSSIQANTLDAPYALPIHHSSLPTRKIKILTLVPAIWCISRPSLEPTKPGKAKIRVRALVAHEPGAIREMGVEQWNELAVAEFAGLEVGPLLQVEGFGEGSVGQGVRLVVGGDEVGYDGAGGEECDIVVVRVDDG